MLGASVAVAVACLCLSTALASAGQPEQPRAASLLRATFASYPDYMDPQLSYTQEGWTSMYDTYIPLLTYRHAGGKAGSEVIPGLARSLPKISDGGRTYTLFLRRGLRYSNGTSVHASDFEYAVERMFRLYSGGLPFYMDVVGAKQFLRKKSKDVSGIATDDRSGRIVIHLQRPNGAFTQELALMFVAPVPPTTPLRDMSAHPPPATGPYAITRSRPGVSWSYARNPAWKRNGRLMPQLPDGHVDRIAVKEVFSGEEQIAGIESGRFDWMENPPPAARIGELSKRFGGTRFRSDRTLSTYYFWMNTRKPPFDDVRVRRAVNYAVDAAALRRVYSGQVAPTHQILPPEMPGYRRFDLYPHDMGKARRLLREANPSDRRITVWTDTESPNDEAGIYYAGVLRKLGFHARLKVVNADNYFTVIGNTSTPNLDTGWSNWFADFPHPDDWFQPLLWGRSILPTYNGNFAQIDAPALNSKIARLRREPLGASEERRYAALDRNYMKLAPWVPYGTRTLSTFVSKRVDLGRVVFNPAFGADLASFRVK